MSLIKYFFESTDGYAILYQQIGKRKLILFSCIIRPFELTIEVIKKSKFMDDNEFKNMINFCITKCLQQFDTIHSIVIDSNAETNLGFKEIVALCFDIKVTL